MKTSILIICTLLITSCATQKDRLKSPKKFDEIRFGSMGGFTGAENNYLLKANGDVFKVTDEIRVQVNRIKKSEVRTIEKLIKAATFYKLDINETGNMTYFIDVKAGDVMNEVSWGNSPPNSELEHIYKILINTLKPETDE